MNGPGTPITVRLSDAQLTQLDMWRAKQFNPPTRPEALRRLMIKALGETLILKRDGDMDL